MYTGKSTINEAWRDRNNLLENTVEFNEKSRPKSKEVKLREKNIYDSVNTLDEGRELTLNAFKSRVFPIKATQGKGLKILTPTQMLTNN